MPERANFLLTMNRILALLDEAPGVDENPSSTRFHWQGPLHQYLWRDLQHGEVHGTPHYPQPPQNQRVDSSCIRRAMFFHILPSRSSSVSTFTGSTLSIQTEDASSNAASNTTEPAAGSSAQEQDITTESDMESVDITAAVVFGPLVKIKKVKERMKAPAMAPGPSNSLS